MSKTLSCRDVGMDCDFTARGETEEEIMQQIKEHALTHNFTEKELTEEFLNRIKSAIKDE